MKGYNYSNATRLPDYFDDIIDSSENPPYSYRTDLRIHLASENGYKVFYILAEALLYMKYGVQKENNYNRTEGVSLAAEYIKILLSEDRIKIRLSLPNCDKGSDPRYYLNSSDADELTKDIQTRWSNIQSRRIEKIESNTVKGISFPFQDDGDDPDNEEFLFYCYDGVSVSHPDDPFWDEITTGDGREKTQQSSRKLSAKTTIRI